MIAAQEPTYLQPLACHLFPFGRQVSPDSRPGPPGDSEACQGNRERGQEGSGGATAVHDEGAGGCRSDGSRVTVHDRASLRRTEITSSLWLHCFQNIVSVVSARISWLLSASSGCNVYAVPIVVCCTGPSCPRLPGSCLTAVRGKESR